MDPFFKKLSSNLEPSNTLQAQVTQHHTSVRSVLESQLDDVNTVLIGSLHPKKLTRIHPEPGNTFDIDILVEIDSFHSWASSGHGISTQIAFEIVGNALNSNETYRNMGPEVEEPTVTFDYQGSGVKVEIVPAYRDKIGHFPDGRVSGPLGRGYWVAKENGNWDYADYDYDAVMVSEINKVTNGAFIPLVKQVKALKRVNFPEIINSHHLEVVLGKGILALASNGNLPIKPRMLLAEVLKASVPFLVHDVAHAGSSSPSVSLAPTESQYLSRLFVKLGDALLKVGDDDIRESVKIELLRSLFGNAFPVSLAPAS